MGLALDSSVVIAAERHGETVTEFLRGIARQCGNQRVVLTAVGLSELVHAIYRAPTDILRNRREIFIGDLLTDLEVLPFGTDAAFTAGRIDGEQRALGITIPGIDLLIGATALSCGYSVMTRNLRHFRMIPGLTLVQF
jgi:predicted nucleic acid-binding protein